MLQYSISFSHALADPFVEMRSSQAKNKQSRDCNKLTKTTEATTDANVTITEPSESVIALAAGRRKF